MKTVEYWCWYYRDPQLGCLRRTAVALTAEEAAGYPQAERIAGTLSLREIDDDLGRSRDDVRSKESAA